MKFTLQSNFKPTGDQPEAIAALIKNLENKKTEQVFTPRNIAKIKKSYTGQFLKKIIE